MPLPGPSDLSHSVHSETISDEVKAEVMAGLEKICKEKVPDGAKWAEVGDGSNHSDICRSVNHLNP